MTPWRTIDGEPQKRCPTCAARGREEWHAYPAFALDARRKNGLTIRCRECKGEDFQNWRESHPEAYANAVARNIQRDRDNPADARQRERDYATRSRTEHTPSRGVRTIIDGVEYATRTEAARRLGVTLSAISKRISRQRD